MQAREHAAVAAIRLHPIAAPLGNHGRTDDHARLPPCRQMAVNPESTRPGLVHEVQDPVAGPQRAHDLVERLEVAGDDPVVPDLAVAAPFGNRHIDRVFVNVQPDVQPDKHVTFPHDRHPRVWRCAPSRDAPHNPRDDEDGRSLSVRPRDAEP